MIICVLQTAFLKKTAVVKIEELSWVIEGIKLFGFAGLEASVMLGSIKKGMEDPNLALRAASIRLLGVLSWLVKF